MSNIPEKKSQREHTADFRYAVARKLASSQVPGWRHGILCMQPITCPDAASRNRFRKAMLTANVITDTSRLKLDANSIQRFIEQRSPISSILGEEIAGAARLGDLDDLSERLADAAVHHPSVVRSAIAGRLATAVRKMPPIGAMLPDGTLFGVDQEEALLTLLVELSAHLQLIALCRAGRDARRRYFRPTGIRVLDHQRDRRATTVQHVVDTIKYNQDLISPILDMYNRPANQPLTREEDDMISAFPGLVQHGRRVLTHLGRNHGRHVLKIVNGWHRAARAGSRLVRSRVNAIEKECHENKTVTKFHGEDALVLLWLTCLQAAAWREEDENKRIGVYRALRRMRDGLDPVEQPMPKRSNEAARELFFLIRNLVAKDPGSHGFCGPNAPVDLDKVEQVYWNEAAKRTAKTSAKTTLSNEAFRSNSTKGARKIYDDAVARGDQAFIEEVRGPLWRQLHL